MTHASHASSEACCASLRARGYEVLVAAMDGTLTPEDIRTIDKVAIVFGNEHKGASAAMRSGATGSYRIPMVGMVESLNVSVASALTLYVGARGRQGDLSEGERDDIRARLLLGQVRDAEGIVRSRSGA